MQVRLKVLSALIWVQTNPGRSGRGSFRPGSFRPNFWGESIRPILVGRFGRDVSAVGCFGPWGGGTLNFLHT